MTPAARVAAAIEILDTIFDGAPAERALTRWGRARRFAGSKDRAAIRDHVFDALRNLRSYAWLGGAPWPNQSGRAVMIGAVRAQHGALDVLFSGQGHAPDPLTEQEMRPSGEMPDDVAWNLPDHVAELFQASLAEQAFEAAQIMGARAPVTLRVNLAKTTREQAATRLQDAGILTEINPLSATALTVTEGARQVQRSAPFLDGEIELQDASSQAVIDALPLEAGLSVLDFCAGGGGKALALAMHTGAPVWAYDVDPARMGDIPDRAARAGVQIQLCHSRDQVPERVALVLADSPCSGSGAWRRAPDAKWQFSADRLVELTAMQDIVLQQASMHVAPGGCLAYATCSVFKEENEMRVEKFLSDHAGWRHAESKSWPISAFGDGFFCALLVRE